MLVTCTIQMCWIYISCIWQRNMLFSYSARSTTFQSRINLWDQKEYQLRAGVLNIICPTSNTWAVECITLFYISLSTEKCGISVIQAELCVLCVVSTSLGCWPCTPLSCVGLRVCQRKVVILDFSTVGLSLKDYSNAFPSVWMNHICCGSVCDSALTTGKQVLHFIQHSLMSKYMEPLLAEMLQLRLTDLLGHLLWKILTKPSNAEVLTDRSLCTSRNRLLCRNEVFTLLPGLCAAKPMIGADRSSCYQPVFPE